VQNNRIAVGPYEILHLLGEGGMAQVFLCVRRGTGQFEKRVVLKVLHPEFLGNQEYVSMFIHEARTLARLRHPNIVDVYEVDRVAQYPYLAMEYVNGPTLGRLHKRAREVGAYDLGYMLHVMYQVCLGLHHAHTLIIDGRPAGIVHRDVSSQNILVDAATGTAKLIDFGIAKTDEELHTQIGVLKGKLAYMAPEVLRGQRADARADVYAVGVLLYRLVTDRLPFSDSDGFSTARLSGRYPRPSRVAPGISPQMEAIIVRALQPSPEDRYQTAEDLALDLAHEIDRLGTNVRQMSQWLKVLFPGGEHDWARRPGGDSPTRATAHSALSHLVSSNTMRNVIRPPERSLLLVAIAGLLTVFGFGALGLLGGILFALSPSVSFFASSPADTREEVVTYLDAADDLMRQNQVEAARSMNARAEAMGVEDLELVVRLANQKGAIERREAVLRASDRIQSGNLEEARQILASTLERFPSDDELRSQLATLNELMTAQPTPAPQATARAPAASEPQRASVAALQVQRPEPKRIAVQPQEAATLGEIRVTTTPPSLIALDGALMGLSPVTIPSVSGGAHEIEARLGGYRTERAAVEVKPGAVIPVQLVLQPAAGASAEPVAVAPAPVASTPVPQAPAPAAPKASVADELPSPSEVTTPYEMHAALAPIQEALVSSGVDAALAKAVLADLESSSVPRLEAGQTLRVNPRSIYDLVLNLANSGVSRRDIQATLRKSFQSGSLN
jgi:serine/threonine protein kinase